MLRLFFCVLLEGPRKDKSETGSKAFVSFPAFDKSCNYAIQSQIPAEKIK